jgi:hypothetical protein
MEMSVRAAGKASLTETHHERRLLRLLATSRYLIGIAIVGTFVGATALLVYGVVETHALGGQARPGEPPERPSPPLTLTL